jgi:hypothetical protein
MLMLFDMILNSAASWVVGQALDTVASCFICGQRDQRRVANRQWNHLECSNCHACVKQFTNACDDTVNQATGQIAHVIALAGQWTWQRNGFFRGMFSSAVSGPGPQTYVPFQLLHRGFGGRTLVFKCTFRDYEDDDVLHSCRRVWTPCACRNPKCDRNRIAWWQPSSMLEEHKIIAADVQLLSEHKAVLFEDRRLTDWHSVK